MPPKYIAARVDGKSVDFQVQTSFKNRNAPEIGDYGVDHVRLVEALGGIAMRVIEPAEIQPAIRKARSRAQEHSIPVVVEVITERVTNIAMGPRSIRLKSSNQSKTDRYHPGWQRKVRPAPHWRGRRAGSGWSATIGASCGSVEPRVHYFASELADLGPVSHVRFNIITDGGISRLRLWSEFT